MSTHPESAATNDNGAHDGVVESKQIVRYDITEADIEATRQKYAGIEFGTPKGYDEGRKALAYVRETRVSIEKRRVALKAESLAYGRKVDSVAKHFTALLEEIEEPLKLKKKAVDDEAARIKAEAEAAERAVLEAQIKAERDAEEARVQAQRDAEEAERKARHEAEAQRLREEAARLEAQRAELEEQRRKVEEAQRAEQERLDAQLKAEVERIATEQRAEADRLAAERKALDDRKLAEELAKRAEELAKQEEARAEQAQREAEAAAERERVAQERAELDRQREELRLHREEAARVEAQREAERAEAERAAAEAEQAERLAELERQRLAAIQPDVEKIRAFAADIGALRPPAVTSRDAQVLIGETALLLADLASRLEAFVAAPATATAAE